jgi:hypothetical protein
LLGDSKPKHDYKPKADIEVEVLVEYKDLQLNKLMTKGTKCVMKMPRAIELQGLGYVRCFD